MYINSHFINEKLIKDPLLPEFCCSSVLRTFYYLNFITAKFAITGILNEDQIEIFIRSIIKSSSAQPSFPAASIFLEWINADLDTFGKDDYQYQSRLHFKFTLLKKLVCALPDSYCLDHVVPVINQTLIYPMSVLNTSLSSIKWDNSTLSQDVWKSLLDSSAHHPNTVRVCTIDYAELLLHKLDHGIDFKVVKERFRNITRALSDFSPYNTSQMMKIKSLRGESLSFQDIEDWKEESLQISWNCIELLLNAIRNPKIDTERANTEPITIRSSSSELTSSIIQIKLLQILFAQISVV